MLGMKHTFILLTALAALVTPSVAQAQTAPQSWIDQSVEAADTYWGTPTPNALGNCPNGPTVVQGFLGTGLSDPGGVSTWANCEIMINVNVTWQPYFFCIALVHEWGHYTLGPTYFAASNPDDPAHAPAGTTGLLAITQESADVYSLNIPACEKAANAIDPPTVIQRHRQRHKRHPLVTIIKRKSTS